MSLKKSSPPSQETRVARGSNNMDVTPIIGSVAASLTTMSFLPQVIKTWRSKSAKDISTAMLMVLATGVLLWLIYGIYLNEFPIIIGNAVTFILACILLTLKAKYR